MSVMQKEKLVFCPSGLKLRQQLEIMVNAIQSYKVRQEPALAGSAAKPPARGAPLIKRLLARLSPIGARPSILSSYG